MKNHAPEPGAGSRQGRAGGGLTWIELLVVVAALAILVALVLPSLAPRPRAPRMQCLSQLKQVGVAFRVFATDHNDRFPQRLSTNAGGVQEWVQPGPGGAGDPTRTFWVFTALSNELAAPRFVVCPADKSRAIARDFHDLAFERTLAQGGQNAAVSYFVNLEADERLPQAILSGDRNLSTVTDAGRAGEYDAFFNTEHRVGPADVEAGGRYGSLDFHFTLHGDRKQGWRWGSVALADGSVLLPTGADVRKQIIASGLEHRWLFPFVSGKNE